MRTLIFQTLEFTVLIPGVLLAYLPVRSSLFSSHGCTGMHHATTIAAGLRHLPRRA